MKFSSILTAACVSGVSAFVPSKRFAPLLSNIRLFSEVATEAPHQVFIGNLPFDVTKEYLEGVISEHSSTHQQVRLIMNKGTGQSKGTLRRYLYY